VSAEFFLRESEIQETSSPPGAIRGWQRVGHLSGRQHVDPGKRVVQRVDIAGNLSGELQRPQAGGKPKAKLEPTSGENWDHLKN
jgi:hypothetical protein